MHLTDILAAAVAALLTGMGMGSGGVLVIYLTLWAEIEQYTAQGLNLLFFLAARRWLFTSQSGGCIPV